MTNITWYVHTKCYRKETSTMLHKGENGISQRQFRKSLVWPGKNWWIWINPVGIRLLIYKTRELEISNLQEPIACSEGASGEGLTAGLLNLLHLEQLSHLYVVHVHLKEILLALKESENLKKNSTVELYMPNYVYFKACLVCQETVSITAMETPKLVIILRGKKGHRYSWEGKVSSRHLVLWMPLSLCCVFFLVLPGTCLRALDSRCYIPRSRKQDSAQKNLFETLRVQGRKTSGSI